MKRDYNKIRKLLKSLGYQLINTGSLMVWETDLRDITRGDLLKVKAKVELVYGKVSTNELKGYKYVVRFCYNPKLNTLFKECVVRPSTKKARELSDEYEFKAIDYVNRYHSKDLSFHYLQNWDSITHLTLEEQSVVYLETRQGKGKLLSEVLDYTRGRL